MLIKYFICQVISMLNITFETPWRIKTMFMSKDVMLFMLEDYKKVLRDLLHRVMNVKRNKKVFKLPRYP